MPRPWPTARLAPLIAGLSGLTWFWFELAPQRAGFEDTDNPAVGLRFIAGDPLAWPLGGLSLAIAAIAIVVTVISSRERLEPVVAQAPSRGGPGFAGGALHAIGLIAATFLLGQAATRLAGGPVLYVQSLDQGWGETAYLVTQFVGVQLFAVGGLGLLAIWSLGVAWVGVRHRAIPRGVAILAVVPGFRLLGILGVLHIQPEGFWIFYMASIPGAFAWLIVVAVTMTSIDTLAETGGASPEAVLRAREASG